MKKIVLLATLCIISVVYAQQQNFADSLLSTTDTLQNINEINDKSDRLEKLVALSKNFKANGNTEKAIEILKKSALLKDSLLNQKNDKALKALSIYYEAEKKEKEWQLQKEQLAKQKFISWFIAILSLFILLLTYVLFKRKQIQQQQATQQAIMQQQNIAAKAVLEAEENERKRIAGDLHDGVGQMMSAVKMNLSSLCNKLTTLNEHESNLLEKTLLLVDESCKEVRTVSHNMMPNALLKAGLSRAVKEFLDKIDHTKLQVNVYTEGLDTTLTNTHETVLYRIIQEAVNNVIKHAQASKLDITLIKDADAISCTIEDNGKGFNVVNKDVFEGGIGIKNIKSRINYLQGTVEWSSMPNKGTLVAIHVPIKAEV